MALIKKSLAAGEAQEFKPAKNNGRCSAHGCPMPGSITETTHANDSTKWFCRFHFGKDFEEWDSITAKVRAMSQEERFPSNNLYQPGLVNVKKVKLADPSTDWALEIIALHEAGKYSSSYGLRLAKEALGISEKKEAA